MTEREQQLVRRVLLWALALSVLAAPRTFATAPAPLPDWLAPAHVVVFSTMWVVLWRRWVAPNILTVAIAAAAVTASAITAHEVAEAIVAGDVPAAAITAIVMPALVSAAGVAFVGLRFRAALAVAAVSALALSVAVVLGAGDQGGELLRSHGTITALRFGGVAVVLFAIVARIAETRGAERDAVGARLRDATRRTRQLETRDAMLERLFAETAHELKNPLAVVRTASETLRDHRERLTDEQLRAVEAQLFEALRRLEQRTEQVLVHDTATSSRHPRTVQITTAVRAAVDAVVSDTSRIDLVLTDEATVHIDPEALEHVLENLVSNAQKYGPASGHITITVLVDDDDVHLSVHDDGTSLTAEDAERVFERGFRARPEDPSTPGTGVGLALVARLVDDWGGDVRCTTGEDGTTFVVTIPVSHDPVPVADAAG